MKTYKTQSIEEITFEMLKAQNAELLKALKQCRDVLVITSNLIGYKSDTAQNAINIAEQAITNAEKLTTPH